MKMKLSSSKLLVLLTLAGTLILAACGDPTATPAPAPTPVPPTAVPATATAVPATATSVPTTAAATPTKAPTTAAATTVAATTAAGNPSGNVTLPAISGTTEVALDPAITAELTKQLPGGAIKLYSSDDDPAKLGTNADATIIGAGYKFGIPNQTKPVKGDNEAYFGVYSKAGAADLVMITGLVPKTPAELTSGLGITGVNPADTQKLLDQLKGKKSTLFIIADPTGLLSQLIAGFASIGTDTPGATTTTAAATTPASSSALTVDESVLKVYAGAKRLDSSPGKVGNQITVYYLSSDKLETITDGFKKAYDPFGDNKDVNSSVFSGGSSSGNLQITAAKYKLSVTFVGPKSQTDADYKAFVAAGKPGPEETLIVAVLSPPSN